MAKASSRLCFDDDELEIWKNVEEQSRAAKDSTCNAPWNPFSPRHMKVVDQGTACNDLMFLKHQICGSTSDTTSGSSISQQVSDTTSTSPFVTSNVPEEEYANNPFDMDSAEVASTTSQPLDGAEEWANNPLTEDFAKAADSNHEEDIPNEDTVVQPIALTSLAKLIAGSTKVPFGGEPVVLVTL